MILRPSSLKNIAFYSLFIVKKCKHLEHFFYFTCCCNVVPTKTFPSDSPATALISEIVSVGPDDKNFTRFLRERKQRFLAIFAVLQQYQRFPHCFSGQVMMHLPYEMTAMLTALVDYDITFDRYRQFHKQLLPDFQAHHIGLDQERGSQIDP